MIAEQKKIAKLIKKSTEQEIRNIVFKSREKIPKMKIEIMTLDENLANQFITGKEFNDIFEFCEINQFNTSKDQIPFYAFMGSYHEPRLVVTNIDYDSGNVKYSKKNSSILIQFNIRQFDSIEKSRAKNQLEFLNKLQSNKFEKQSENKSVQKILDQDTISVDIINNQYKNTDPSVNFFEIDRALYKLQDDNLLKFRQSKICKNFEEKNKQLFNDESNKNQETHNKLKANRVENLGLDTDKFKNNIISTSQDLINKKKEKKKNKTVNDE